MDWAACWCAFCALLRPDCRIICLCLFLHVTMNLVTHCAPLLVARQHGASLVQPQTTLNCVHSAVGDEAYHCTPLHGSECTDRHGLSYTRDQLLCFQAALLGPSLTSYLRELSIRDRFSRSSRGGRWKQRRIAVVCCSAAREPEAKRWLEVVSCNPCHASPLPSPPLSQTRRSSPVPHCRPTYHLLPLYNIPSTVLVSWCVTAVLRTASSTHYNVLSTSFPLYDVPSTVLVSQCDTAVLQTSTLYDIPSTLLVSQCDTAVLQRPLHRARLQVQHHRPMDTPLNDIPSIVLVSRCDTAVLRTASFLCYNIPSTVLFPCSAKHANHDTTGKCKLWQFGHSYSTA